MTGLLRAGREARTRIGAEALFAILKSEFEAARAFECATLCQMPLPVLRDAAGAEQPNWTVIVPAGCPRFCHRVIEAIVERNGQRYELSS